MRVIMDMEIWITFFLFVCFFVYYSFYFALYFGGPEEEEEELRSALCDAALDSQLGFSVPS